MRRLIVIISILYSCLALAKSSYQIDLIIFAHPNQNKDSGLGIPFIPMSSKAILLKVNPEKSTKPYYLLPRTYSSLNNEYYLLSHKSHYQVLGHYSWRQPANSQSAIALPFVSIKGWQMQGILHVTEGTYYNFAAKLQFSPPNNPQSSFTVSQKQRLKANVVYYLDNAQIGMLVKIQKRISA